MKAMGSLIWWILPAVTGVIGLMLFLSGVGKLIGARLATGGARLLLGTGVLGITGVVAFAGLNLQTYQRLTYERTIATISFEPAEGADAYTARLVFDGGETAEFPVSGDEFTLRARVIKFKPMANLLGYDSIYKFDRLETGFAAEHGDSVVRVVRVLSEDPGLNVFAMVRQRGQSLDWVDTAYGSAVYNPMAAGLSYTIRMNQSGLEAEPANATTRAVVMPKP